MKTPTILAASVLMTTGCVAGDCQTDTFKTKGGKEVVITAIKHASLRIQYDGLEIQVDPVVEYAPATDYSKFPKADVILVTHEHFDHFDRDAIAALRKDGDCRQPGSPEDAGVRHGHDERREPRGCEGD